MAYQGLVPGEPLVVCQWLSSSWPPEAGPWQPAGDPPVATWQLAPDGPLVIRRWLPGGWPLAARR